MNRRIKTLVWALFAVAVAALPACRGPVGGIDPAALAGPLPKVLDRHDAYVGADQTLSDLEREVFLATSKELRSVLAAALEARAEGAPK